MTEHWRHTPRFPDPPKEKPKPPSGDAKTPGELLHAMGLRICDADSQNPWTVAEVALEAIAAAGWQVVPKEPTQEMDNAASDKLDWGPPGYWDAAEGSADPSKCWRLMLAAAPKVTP